MKQRSRWIDCAKFMAIMAVLADHSYNVLYANNTIHWASFYSVSLFVIISGMLSFKTIDRHNRGWFQTFVAASEKMYWHICWQPFSINYTKQGASTLPHTLIT